VHHDLAHVLRQAPHDLLEKYTQTLAQYPLPTKMATGATLAVAGDAIAQAKNDEEYDVRRASSFGVFDMAYRALQHASFPLIVASFHGQFLSSFFSNPDLAAAMEQTLASQLGIVPFLYYPAFFALTGAVQGLNAEAAVTRAKENFLPLMKRNLMFWIPVQFIQFAFIQEDLQIPFLSVCGLAWTFILSVNAGSTKSYVSEEAEVMTTIELNAPPMYEMETAKVEEEEVDLRVVESVIR
jgi:protein Mpv17